MEGEFLEGLKHGLWQTFNKIGQPLMIGYYDRGNSKDLGHNLEFRSQIEFSYQIGLNRIGFNLNHISNASIGDTNPGTESATISLIRSF